MIMLLLKLLAIFTVTGACTTFLGYWVHWSFHQPWALWFHKAHMNHHQIQYPSTDFFSEKYRHPGRDSTVILFGIVFAPLLLLVGGFMLFGVISLTAGLTTFISLGLWGFAHDYFHDQFHLNNSWWKKFPTFINWRRLHYVHHLNMSLNFGIVFFGWDKMFKTFDSADEVNLES
jgi:sterol desaturase/sphingolipid hydroxylase (fatty acid hydroxylase superfamily)